MMMKKFLLKLFLFSLVLLGLLLLGILLPCTPRSSESLLFAQIEKDKLLRHTPGKRIILVGGSNLSFGINSKMLSDQLKMPVINAGVHAKIGLQYMMDHSLPFIHAGDVVVLVPEYNQFFGNFAYGGEELLRTLLDVDASQLGLLNFQQIKNLLPLLPEYAFSKFRQREYFYHFDKDNVYLKTAFNAYGDVYKHWTQVPEKVLPDKVLEGAFNQQIIEAMKDYQQKIEALGGRLLLGFPSYQASSFDVNRKGIAEVEKQCQAGGFQFLGNAIKFRMADTLFFNTTYHLNKQGVELRTQNLAAEIKQSLK
jgi:hypothetical protein